MNLCHLKNAWLAQAEIIEAASEPYLKVMRDSRAAEKADHEQFISILEQVIASNKSLARVRIT